MVQIIMHIDLNAFFASCEEIRDPSLVGKPLLIGHEGRSGIVATASYAARKYGCHSGQPMFQALAMCPSAIVVEPHYDFYSMMSLSFFAYVRRYSTIIEKASIDEGYVDMTGPLSKTKDPEGYLRAMQLELKKEIGLGCSIGIAPTKWLAKMASDLHKPMGLTFLRRKDIPTILYPLPIESFWGIGKKTSPHLRKMGIETIGDLAKKVEVDDPELKKELGKFYFTVKDWIQGRGSDHVDTEPSDPKSIGAQETLSHDCTEYYEVESALHRISSDISIRAKKAHKMGKTITLQVKTTDFALHDRSSTLEMSTDDEETIFEKASSLFEPLMKKLGGQSIRLVGITLGRLVNPTTEVVQMTLWNYQEYEKRDSTKTLIDELNRKMEKPMLKRASEIERKDKK